MARVNISPDLNRHRDHILKGTMLCVDPSSGSAGSMPGYAVYVNSCLVESGTLKVNHKMEIGTRLRQIVELLGALEDRLHPDLLVIERIRGNRAHNYLRWACGVIVAALTCPHIELCISTWRAWIDKATYDKGDEADACQFGLAMIKLANGEQLPKKVRTKKVKVISADDTGKRQSPARRTRRPRKGSDE